MQLPRTESLVSTRRPRARRSLSRSRPRSSQKPWKTKKARAKKPRGSIKGTSRVLVNASSPLKEVRIRNDEPPHAQPRRRNSTRANSTHTRARTHTKHQRRRRHDESDNRTATRGNDYYGTIFRGQRGQPVAEIKESRYKTQRPTMLQMPRNRPLCLFWPPPSRLPLLDQPPSPPPLPPFPPFVRCVSLLLLAFSSPCQSPFLGRRRPLPALPSPTTTPHHRFSSYDTMRYDTKRYDRTRDPMRYRCDAISTYAPRRLVLSLSLSLCLPPPLYAYRVYTFSREGDLTLKLRPLFSLALFFSRQAFLALRPSPYHSRVRIHRVSLAISYATDITILWNWAGVGICFARVWMQRRRRASLIGDKRREGNGKVRISTMCTERNLAGLFASE